MNKSAFKELGFDKKESRKEKEMAQMQAKFTLTDL